ncbi:MAG: aspartate kinase [Dehalococcoidia bacterium]|nr:aspartate kinase [Dehalococcoidia bacterium]
MALIVQKYGGSSVADAERIRNVARRIAATYDGGNQVVVVVSAMGKTTDGLIEMASQLNDNPREREMDLLLSTGEVVSSALVTMALHAMGYDAIGLTGWQAGIRTDALHRRARIVDIDPSRIQDELKQNRIVIVAGFQGMTDEQDITTLGRGASDTTAVAMAAALKAQCQIYTDVPGIFTTDPRVEPRARKLNEISYDEMLELASLGAKVMHNRSVELGAIYEVPITVASSFSDEPGTLIHGSVAMEVRNKVRGIAHDTNVAKITVVGVPDRPGIASSIFAPLAEAGLSVDTIVQNTGIEHRTDLTFTVARTDLAKAMAVIRPIAQAIDARDCVSADHLAKVSIVGTGIQNAPGYAARMFETLSKNNINIDMITTSEIRITCVIEADQVQKAVRALHEAFELEKPEE